MKYVAHPVHKMHAPIDCMTFLARILFHKYLILITTLVRGLKKIFQKMSDFTDQVAIITGASAGIGLSVAELLAEKGVSVVMNARDAGRLEKAVNKIKGATDAGVIGVRGDITKQEIRENVINETLHHFGKVDILINNVGGGTDKHAIETIDEEAWNSSINFNLSSCFHMCRLVIPLMRKNKYGRIVNVSSVAGRFKGRLSGPDYSAAKAGIFGLTRHLAWNHAGDGILVNAVAPGIVATERALMKWNQHSEADKQKLFSQIPLQRFAEPVEIAKPIIFLASKDCSYITGIVLDVNGGFYMC